ncbi:uncharacterized protein [Nicotiana tomentosiformis]|uniref:uncharacterized protein n=1 Tax=Nicotiana tomentosiformis TaxID=4098 RepID=UPI00388CB3BC
MVGWFEPGEARLWGTNMVLDDLEKMKFIQEWLHTAQSKQKCYVDRKVRDVAFMECEKVLLRVSPIKGVMRFGKKVKLCPRYIGPFEVLERVSEVSCKHSLPLACRGFIQCLMFLCFESIMRIASAILDRQVRKMASRDITSAKV